MKFAFLIASVLFAQNIFATGGFNCTAIDETLSLQISGVTTRGMASPVVQSNTTLTYLDGETLIPEFSFNETDISQYWNYDENFNLIIYQEKYDTNDFYETTIVIKTVSTGDGESFKGTYDTSTIQSVNGEKVTHSAHGFISCGVE